MGLVNDNATLTTSLPIGQVQAPLAGAATGFDIIPIQAPPGTYTTTVAIFAANNGIPGTIIFNATGSGAQLQGGVDTLSGGEDLDAYYFYDYVIRFVTAAPMCRAVARVA